jgi:hypothetical protein
MIRKAIGFERTLRLSYTGHGVTFAVALMAYWAMDTNMVIFYCTTYFMAIFRTLFFYSLTSREFYYYFELDARKYPF